MLTETVFSWPGSGLAMYQGISARDIPFIQGGILLLARSSCSSISSSTPLRLVNPKIELQ